MAYHLWQRLVIQTPVILEVTDLGLFIELDFSILIQELNQISVFGKVTFKPAKYL